jgi:UDP-N-acetylmuramoyl-tripeptide--D-alanyl-D-alanine ligase
MKNMTLSNIVAACKGELHAQQCVSSPQISASEVTGVVIDSRTLTPGNLFIATRGEKADGHSFIGDVAAKGALAVVCEEPPTTAIPYILVPDSFKALKDIAIFYRRQIDIPVIGITGSVGKTSTKEFIAAVLETRFKVLKTAGNYNNEIGLPLMILKISDEHQVAVLEMGISDFGEMHRLSQIARPDIAVLTNIGDCHLENLIDRLGVLKAKSEIFDFLADDGHIVVNGDDELLAGIGEIKGKTPLRFGKKEANDIIADQIENLGLKGTAAQIRFASELQAVITKTQKKARRDFFNEKLDFLSDGAYAPSFRKSFLIRVPLPGEHMIYNALAAAAVGSLFGLTEKEIQAGISNVKSVAGRSNIIHLPAGIIIDDCYNANPVSMAAALLLLKNAAGRKVAVLGDMGQLGGEEKSLHALVGREAVASGLDVLVCIGELSRHMYEAAVLVAENNENRQIIWHFHDKAVFLEVANDILQSGDTVLVKASRFMAFETLMKPLQMILQ